MSRQTTLDTSATVATGPSSDAALTVRSPDRRADSTDALTGRALLHDVNARLVATDLGADLDEINDALLLVERLLAGHATSSDRRRALQLTSPAVRHDFRLLDAPTADP